MKLKDRTAIVTGSSSGIGRRIAIEFANQGANVILASRSEDPKMPQDEKTTTEIISDNEGEATYIQTDVSDPDSVESMIKESVDKYGGIDILVNNAGVTSANPIHQVTDDEWNYIFDVNVYGVYQCSKQAIPYLLESDCARVINISSQRGLLGGATTKKAAYVSSKGAVTNLTRQMALDYGPMGIAVNAICPGPIVSNMTRIDSEETRQRLLDGVLTPFVGQPDDVAPAAVLLASDDGRFIHGENLVIDGGYLIK